MWSCRKQQFRQDTAAGWQDSRQQGAESVLQRLSVLQMLHVQQVDVVLQEECHTKYEQHVSRTAKHRKRVAVAECAASNTGQHCIPYSLYVHA
jgi:hypothetical protein